MTKTKSKPAPAPSLPTSLTPRQLDVVVMIRNFRHLNGYSPTLQEMADHLGTSKVTIFEHVGQLERKGVVRRERNKARSLEIIAEIIPDLEPERNLVMLGEISAGCPINCVENLETIDLETFFKSSRGVYALRVVGDSWAGDHLCDGDFVVIERRDRARNGEQVVAILDTGEVALARFYRERDNRVRLQPANATVEAKVLPAACVRVQGVVIGVIRASGSGVV